MRHNTLIRKRTDALTRRDDRWNWKSRNFGNQQKQAAAFRQTCSTTSWRWLTTLFVCKFRLPPFIWGTLLSFFWIATVQRGQITGSFHGCIDSEQGEVKMCFEWKLWWLSTTIWWSKQNPNGMSIQYQVYIVEKADIARRNQAFSFIFQEFWHPETY